MGTPEEFAILLNGARRLAESGGGAMATLLRTRGSAFRRAGARMLIGRDGSLVRRLSEGCPEADLIAQAHDLLNGRGHGTRLVRYDRDHGYDALLELGCGGELEVLLETFADPSALHYLDAVDCLLQHRRSGWLVTAFAIDGHCLPQPRCLVWSDTPLFCDLDEAMIDHVLERLHSQQPATPSTDRLTVDVRCIDVLFEPLKPPLSLYIIGDNAGARALARLSVSLGWLTTIVDHRNDTPGAPLPEDVKFQKADADTLLRHASFDEHSAVVVMPHNLERDLDYLRALRTVSIAYLGALGSRTRATRMRDAISPAVTPLHAPAGLDIGSETPEEIALAISAEIRAVTNHRGGGRLSATSGPIHIR